jgi:small GTP-binding protein
METIVGSKRIRFQFWDTAGQEIYRNIVPVYFKGISGAILVFSMTDRQSFIDLDDWLQQLLGHADENVGVLVCANKIDGQPWRVEQIEAERWANDHRYKILLTSALTGENVNQMIEFVATTFVGPIHADGIEMGTDLNPSNEKTGCC